MDQRLYGKAKKALFFKVLPIVYNKKHLKFENQIKQSKMITTADILNLKERFLTYVSYNTQSDENNLSSPSSEGQRDFAEHLVKELKRIGLTDASADKNGYVMATLPSNSEKELPIIGFIAHLDTSPDASGKSVNARTVLYDGQDIVLNKQQNILLSSALFPELLHYKGQELVVTDGTTLLGSDDKAGVAEIMTAVEYLMAHPEIKHGTIRVGFTPDEEIGRGADRFDVKKFGADWAYTVDGGEIGELEFENFNAAGAQVTFHGRNVHPGDAKDKMINATTLAREYADLLPANEVPEKTENYEGFYHLVKMGGTVEEAFLNYIIRDHDKDKFEEKKQLMVKAASDICRKYGDNTAEIKISDQYYNMIEKIKPVEHIVAIARKAIENCEITPIIKPIRGGTDGARLSFEGLPCPNLFAGGHNFHGRYEFIPIPSMAAAVNVIVEICRLVENKE
jgi:tripeptide aminopeptidase